MSVNVTHAEFTDATTLFTNLAAANEMLNNLSVPAAETASYGVVKKAAASADIDTIQGSSVGASLATAITFNPSDPANPTRDEIKSALIEIAAQINHLKSVLRSAGTLTT